VGHGGVLHTHIDVTVFNPRPTNAHRVLAIGTCNAIRCTQHIAPPEVIPAGKTVQFALNTLLPLDSQTVFGALRKPGVTNVFSDAAFMYLSPEAWSRSNSGRPFGMTLTPRQALTIRNADWDISSQHGVRGTMRLSFDAGLDAATTTLRRCALANAIVNCSS